MYQNILVLKLFLHYTCNDTYFETKVLIEPSIFICGNMNRIKEGDM